ncbi:hypothetical protein IW147_002853 [Coemansia sp. RSA 720]|nr:hypothetical protein IW147_002853 [Coemansia sp. RSA 720]KAJ2544708.1 hypothetical protein GGF49_001058 [Coemansia sp. RSA 1853]KAJ2656179.1 hypothetical protein IW148_005732 [Coemansia sp. RSA 1199]
MDSPINSASHSPEPATTQVQPASPDSLFRPTSQILGQSGGAVFTYNADDKLFRLPVTQFRHSNGKLYIEYVPGNNVLFLPTTVPVDKPLKRVRQAQFRKSAQDTKASKEPAKPHNAFIQYRSYRLEEIKRLFPNASQLDLSRIAAEHWRTEDPKIKGVFQKRYKEELQFYHQQLKIQHMAAEYQERITLPGLAFIAPVPNPYSNTQSAIDYLNGDGPFQFNPKRRRSQSVPPETPGPSSARRIRKV